MNNILNDKLTMLSYYIDDFEETLKSEIIKYMKENNYVKFQSSKEEYYFEDVNGNKTLSKDFTSFIIIRYESLKRGDIIIEKGKDF